MFTKQNLSGEVNVEVPAPPILQNKTNASIIPCRYQSKMVNKSTALSHLTVGF